MKQLFKRLIKSLLIVVIALILFVAIVLGYFTIVEYSPKDKEPLTINNNVDTRLN